jgi:hypothetical protein
LWELTWWDSNDPAERAESEITLHNNVIEAASGNTVRTRAELVTSRGTHEIDFSLIPVANDRNEVMYIIAEARKLVEQL